MGGKFRPAGGKVMDRNTIGKQTGAKSET